MHLMQPEVWEAPAESLENALNTSFSHLYPKENVLLSIYESAQPLFFFFKKKYYED